MHKTKSIWGRYDGKADKLFLFQGGFCRISLKHFSGGWIIKEQRTSEAFGEFSFDVLENAEELNEPHLFQTGRSDILYAQPALPVKPIVFRNNTTLTVSPKQSLQIFLAVPVNIQFYFGQVETEHLITEFSTQRLSDTWFGEPDNGEPAFSVGSRFSTQQNQLDATYFEAVIPIRIHNISNQLMDLQRLIIHVEHLNLYQKGGQLLTDVVSIEFKGQDSISSLQFSTEKSLHGESPQLLSKARQATSKNILGKSFHYIKNFTQL